MAGILEVFPERDGLVRVVSILCNGLIQESHTQTGPTTTRVFFFSQCVKDKIVFPGQNSVSRTNGWSQKNASFSSRAH